MSRLALGTVQFGVPYGIANQLGQVSRDAAKSMLSLAKEESLDTLDTAIAYGESEDCLGEIGTQGFKIVTKLPAIPHDCSDISAWVYEQISFSFSRLNVNHVYGLLLHRSEQLLEKNGDILYQILLALKASGKVKKIGISIYSPSELDALYSRFPVDLVQAPFNLVDRRLLTSGWMKRLKAGCVEIHTRSAFLQGLLLLPQHNLPTQFLEWNDLWGRWHNWLNANNTSAIQASLSYPLTFPEIDRVVVGADSLVQLKQIICASKMPFPLDFPNICHDDERLINPANWSKQ